MPDGENISLIRLSWGYAVEQHIAKLENMSHRHQLKRQVRHKVKEAETMLL
jgi:hypothetical protein